MTRHFDLKIKHPKAITAAQELGLLREAVAQNPISAPLLERMARLLVDVDAFDEAIDVLQRIVRSHSAFSSHELLCRARLSRQSQADNLQVCDDAKKALALAKGAEQRAIALTALGRAQARLGLAEARDSLVTALQHNSHDQNAYRRLASLYLAKNDAQAVLALSDQLLEKGVAHTRLLASRSMAFAQLGQMEAAHQTVGLNYFCHRSKLFPPPGWTDIAAFNSSLADELVNHPAQRFDRYGAASSKTWRIDEFETGSALHVGALQQQIASEVKAFVGRIANIDHPWAMARPVGGIFHNSCVMTHGEGFEEWHVHQHGWLSGVYYVAVPEAVVAGDDSRGCIAFGLPENVVGAEVAQRFGLELTRPEQGLLMLFPSHTYHRTFPHGQSERRICIAFDIWPA